MITRSFNPDVIEFIQENLAKDPYDIALKASKHPELPIRDIALQIESRQKAAKKLPEWIQNNRLIFPPPHDLEQASTEITATYKATLYRGNTLLDITGGTGIDAYYLGKNFKNTVYVEPSNDLCTLASHNFKELGSNIEVHNLSAEQYLNTSTDSFSLIYVDPSRRSNTNKRLVQIDEYQPNVLSLLPKLLAKGTLILVKTSPLVDIKQAISQLKFVLKVICLSVKNEMKELLFELKTGQHQIPIIHAVNIKKDAIDTVSASFDDEKNAEIKFDKPLQYIYEPNTAIRKAGFFKLIALRYGLKKLDWNTHLYTSNEVIEHFPGRILQVKNRIKLDKKTIKKTYPTGIVNVISKNFPLSANEIKKKYALRDGGDDFLIFCNIEGLRNHALQCEGNI